VWGRQNRTFSGPFGSCGRCCQGRDGDYSPFHLVTVDQNPDLFWDGQIMLEFVNQADQFILMDFIVACFDSSFLG